MKNLFLLCLDSLVFLKHLIIKASRPNISNHRLLLSFTNNKSILVGNGPSLSNDIQLIINDRYHCSLFAVNYFALSEFFTLLKPDVYVLTDPIFWRSDTNHDIKSDNANLFSKFNHVDWKMLVVCPYEGFACISSKLKSNTNLSFLYVNSNCSKFHNDGINILSIKSNISTPVFQNVMILTLWLAILSRSSCIDLYGVDFSAFKEYEVDQVTNHLKSNFSHFYKNTTAQSNATSKYKNVPSKMMHNRLLQVTIAFHQMYILSKVAKLLNIAVTNCSSFSYLDCFDRKSSA